MGWKRAGMATPIVVYFERNPEVVFVSLPIQAGALKTLAFKRLVPPSNGRVVSEYVLLNFTDRCPVDAFSTVNEKQQYALELKLPPYILSTSLKRREEESQALVTHTLLSSPNAAAASKDADPTGTDHRVERTGTYFTTTSPSLSTRWPA